MEKRLSANDILNIHDVMIELYGGERGIRDYNLFVSSCEAPYQTFDKNELYPTIYDKAARYLESFAGYQVFVDGNKRTGAAVMLTLLSINGIALRISTDEVVDLTMKIAEHEKLTYEDIVQYLKSKS